MSLTDRAQYIAGLRELADLLDKHDDLPLPYHGTAHGLPITFMFLDTDGKTELARFVRTIPGELAKDASDLYFDLNGTLGGPDGLCIQATAFRNQVCERVVTGTREVTKTVPDPSVEIPQVEITETVEDVEWRCVPLLAEDEAVAS